MFLCFHTPLEQSELLPEDHPDCWSWVHSLTSRLEGKQQIKASPFLVHKGNMSSSACCWHCLQQQQSDSSRVEHHEPSSMVCTNHTPMVLRDWSQVQSKSVQPFRWCTRWQCLHCKCALRVPALSKTRNHFEEEMHNSFLCEFSQEIYKEVVKGNDNPWFDGGNWPRAKLSCHFQKVQEELPKHRIQKKRTAKMHMAQTTDATDQQDPTRFKIQQAQPNSPPLLRRRLSKPSGWTTFLSVTKWYSNSSLGNDEKAIKRKDTQRHLFTPACHFAHNSLSASWRQE